MFSSSPFQNTQLLHVKYEMALRTRTVLPTLLGLAGSKQDFHGMWVSMVFNPLLGETVHGEVDCNVFKTRLSVTNKICILDRATYGCYLALGRTDLCCK